MQKTLFPPINSISFLKLTAKLHCLTHINLNPFHFLINFTIFLLTNPPSFHSFCHLINLHFYYIFILLLCWLASPHMRQSLFNWVREALEVKLKWNVERWWRGDLVIDRKFDFYSLIKEFWQILVKFYSF